MMPLLVNVDPLAKSVKPLRLSVEAGLMVKLRHCDAMVDANSVAVFGLVVLSTITLGMRPIILKLAAPLPLLPICSVPPLITLPAPALSL